MTRVGYLTSSCIVAAERADAFEHHLGFDPIHAACAERDIELEAVVWDDEQLKVEEFDAFVIGTTWDYQERPEEFLDFLQRVADRRPLWNSLETVRWNLQKTYLRDLEQRGVPVVPTRFVEHVDARAVDEAFEEFECDRVVIKPLVGATAWRQSLVDRSAALPPEEELPPGAALVQPFLPAVVDEGEYAFVFFDGVYSHCALKVPKSGDYRVQAVYGGTEKTHDATPQEIEACRRVLGCVDDRLLYARIDMIRGADGELAVMELELIEPYYYPLQGEDVGGAFASALERFLSELGEQGEASAV